MPAAARSEEHEFITVSEFARRVHRSRKTVYGWISMREMPEGSVVDVHGHYEVDWTVWQASVHRII